MNRVATRQAGATLIVALLMLSIIAVLGVNAINQSTVDLRIVSNMQGRLDAAAAVQDAVEQVIGNKDSFLIPAAQTIRIDRTGYGDYLDVAVAAPVCREATSSEGYSATTGSPTEDTVWEVTATVTDPMNGARAEVHQGVAVVLKRGSCPAP